MQRDEASLLPSFVGREPELAALVASVRRAHAGRGRPVLLLGEPGIGKTRVVEELARRLAIAPERTLVGHAHEQEGVPAYWPWVQILRRLGEVADERQRAAWFASDAAVVAQILPGVHGGIAAAPEAVSAGGAADAEASRLLLFDAVSSILRRAAGSVPLLLVLEDLHWADESSLLLLLHVAGRMRDARFAIVGTARPVAGRLAPALLSDVLRRCRRVAVAGLDPDDVGRLVAVVGGLAEPASSRLVEQIHAATGGNPLFLGEIVRDLRREHRLDVEDIEPEALRPSDGVRAFIRRHVAPLSDEEQRLLRVASVTGLDFDSGLLAAVAGCEREEVLAGLEAAVELRLVAPAGAPGSFRFAHALIRETLYGDLSPGERAQLHLDYARALERRGRPDDVVLAELAHHYYYAAPLGNAARAAECAKRAGALAVERLAFADAVAQFERALAVSALLEPDDGARLELHLALGDAASGASDLVKARASYDRAIRLARGLGDAQALARAAQGLAAAHDDSPVAEPGLIAVLDEALHRIGEAASPRRATLLARLAAALYFTGETRRREDLARAALAMARELGDAGAIAGALLTRCLLEWGETPVADRLSTADEALAVARSIDHPGLAFEASTWRFSALLEGGDPTAAAVVVELERVAGDAAGSRQARRRRTVARIRAAMAMHEGRFSEATRLAESAHRRFERSAGGGMGAIWVLQQYLVRRETGGVASSATAIADQARSGSPPLWRCALALLEFENGHPERARGLLGELAVDGFAGLPRDGNQAGALALCAELAWKLGDPDVAQQVWERLRVYEGRNVVLGHPPVGSLGAAARYLGLAAAAAGRRAAAVRHLEAAIEFDDRTGARPQAAQARADLATLLGGGKAERARAVDLVAHARRIAVEHGMAPLLRRLDAPSIGEGAHGTAVARSAGSRREASGRAATVDPAVFAATYRRDGEFWTVAHAGSTARFRDAKGFALLHLLLRHPGREFHVLELEGGLAPAPASPGGAFTGSSSLAAAGLATHRGGDAGEMLDSGARAAYRARLEALGEELREARERGDVDRVAAIDVETGFLAGELSRGVGLGGRVRKAASPVERARVNVSRSVGRVVRRIAESNPALGRHLERAVRTGIHCSYSPAAGIEERWAL